VTKRLTPQRAAAIERHARRYLAAPPHSRARGAIVRDLAKELDSSTSWARRLCVRSAIGCREWDAAVADGLITPAAAQAGAHD
jgi:hypothetical protein